MRVSGDLTIDLIEGIKINNDGTVIQLFKKYCLQRGNTNIREMSPIIHVS